MANIDGPSGLRPVRHKSGGTGGRISEYTIASGLAADLFYGDLVKSTGTGRDITIAAAGDVLLGTFAGFHYIDATGRPKFARTWPSGNVGSEVVVGVFDDPNQVFLVQATTIALANIGALCDHQVGTGNAKTGNSGAEVDGTTYGTGTSLKVMRVSPEAGNDYGDNANVEVIIVTHELEG